MAIHINNNIASLRAQRETSRITKQLGDVQTRLSSGLRINRAVDDAAGLAIASSLNVQARIYSQSIRNINDGISALDIANGAVDNLSNLLVRLRELATQASNGTLSDRQRSALDKEAQALRDEYTRIVNTTAFNGIRLIHHETNTTYIQAGTTNPLFRLTIDSANLATGETADGTFDQNYTSGVDNPTDIVSGDFNGDGIIDIASVGGGPDLNVSLGNGDGTFHAIAGAALPANSYGITAGDFDNDGKLDLMAAGDDGSINFYRGVGDGTFSLDWSQNINASGSYILKSGDFDNDGALDFIAVDGDDHTLTVGMGNNDGTFNVLPEQVFNNGTSLAIGDLDGDNILDIVVGWNVDSSAQVLFGAGDGTFVNQDGLNTNSAQNVALVDMNGDGYLDVISGEGAIDILLNDGAGNFINVFTASASGNAKGFATGDFNGDGHMDIATNTDNGTFGILFGDGTGIVSELTTDYASGTSSPAALLALDINGDGVLDLVSSELAGDDLKIALGHYEITSYLNAIDISTKSGALAAMDTLSEAQQKLAQAVGKIGSEQSRLFTALSNILSARENYLGAASRITDADVATESSNYLRLQILQRAASSVMSQANQQPALAIRLLTPQR